MNCQLCQKEFVAFHNGRLPVGIRTQVENHLQQCKECTDQYFLIILAEKVMDEEKRLPSNPFLITRIMAGIDELEHKQAILLPIPVYQKALKPILITISIAAALILGIVFGDIYVPSQPVNKLPVEMTYINDAVLESVDLFSKI